MKPLIALLVLLATTATSPTHAQTLCTLRVFQGQQEVPATFIGGVRKYTLKPTPFSLEVAPAHCAPTIVTAPSLAIAREIGEKPLIYSHRLLYLVATLPEQSGDLLWAIPHRLTPDERPSQNPGTFTGKQYLKLCDELRFCAKPFPIYSSGQPFAADDIGSKSRATFTRLDAARPLQALKGQQILNIVYTLWRSLPSEYPMADPIPLLFQPHFVLFSFEGETNPSSLEIGPKPPATEQKAMTLPTSQALRQASTHH